MCICCIKKKKRPNQGKPYPPLTPSQSQHKGHYTFPLFISLLSNGIFYFHNIFCSC
ncbi:hypothetical protein Lalb_Chr14g0366881 [Lupinus albus]|uniref:Uncharacterized protein n=1 Tax=Lupinus albus TaxID=3870 RepID=A0A6A4P507_LUPAL|nr:hypothetical protein Lalb_Chr14g0366881 [Lupinus albus]